MALTWRETSKTTYNTSFLWCQSRYSMKIWSYGTKILENNFIWSNVTKGMPEFQEIFLNNTRNGLKKTFFDKDKNLEVNNFWNFFYHERIHKFNKELFQV